MNLLEIVNSIVLTIGIPTLVAAAIYIGRKFQVLDSLEEIIKHEIRPDMRDMRERLTRLESDFTVLRSDVSRLNRDFEILSKRLA